MLSVIALCNDRVLILIVLKVVVVGTTTEVVMEELAKSGAAVPVTLEADV